MRISGCIIHKKDIIVNLDDFFCAIYKSKKLYVNTTHDFGKAKDAHLTRFLIKIVDIESRLNDLYTYKDCRTIREAIRYALKEANLIKSSNQ